MLVFIFFIFFSDDKMCSLMFNRSFILKREKKTGLKLKGDVFLFCENLL